MHFDSDELAVMAVYAPVMLKILHKREANILNRITGEFRQGKTDHTANLAEFCSVRDQIHEITNALKLRDQK